MNCVECRINQAVTTSRLCLECASRYGAKVISYPPVSTRNSDLLSPLPVDPSAALHARIATLESEVKTAEIRAEHYCARAAAAEREAAAMRMAIEWVIENEESTLDELGKCEEECCETPMIEACRKSIAADAGAALAREMEALRVQVIRLEEWTHQYGAALKPKRADTYGEGMRDAKDQVKSLLRSPLDAARRATTVAPAPKVPDGE